MSPNNSTLADKFAAQPCKSQAIRYYSRSLSDLHSSQQQHVVPNWQALKSLSPNNSTLIRIDFVNDIISLNITIIETFFIITIIKTPDNY